MNQSSDMNALEQLRKELPNLPKKLAQAARYALDCPDKIALQSMRVSAAEVGVTSTTMLRLARHIGFDSYEAFRSAFQDQLVSQGFGARAGALQQDALQNGEGTLSGRILAQASQNIAQASMALDPKQLSRVAKLMRDAPSCYLVGSGSLFWLASMMKNTGSMVLPGLRLVGAEFAVAAETMGRLSTRDMVIGFSINPCAIRTIDALEYARSQGATTVALTDRPSAPSAAHADFVFCGKTDSQHYYPSTIALAALAETLLATVVAEGDGSEIAQIETYEQLRKSGGGYVEY